MFKVLSYGVFKKGTPLFKITKSAVKNLNIHFDELNDHLNEKKWIDGNKFSLADITWMVLFHRLEESQLTNYFLNNRGNLIGYFNRLKARESYKSELLDYEENSIKVGKDKLIIAIESNQTLNKYYSFIKIL
jgi:glutathione S-transferase|tara:strand:- start:2418 stop:2813 length:396 start_codon:yes stop_codon:yes gene_type:complete